MEANKSARHDRLHHEAMHEQKLLCWRKRARLVYACRVRDEQVDRERCLLLGVAVNQVLMIREGPRGRPP